MTSLRTRLLVWVVVFVCLWWFWLLLAGEWNRAEWIVGAVAAVIAATATVAALTRARVRARVPLRLLPAAVPALLMVVVDFGILMWVLLAGIARRRIVRGRFVTRRFTASGTAAEQTGMRAWIGLVSTYSPNAYIVEIDPEEQTVLLHDLVQRRSSEKPA